MNESMLEAASMPSEAGKGEKPEKKPEKVMTDVDHGDRAPHMLVRPDEDHGEVSPWLVAACPDVVDGIFELAVSGSSFHFGNSHVTTPICPSQFFSRTILGNGGPLRLPAGYSKEGLAKRQISINLFFG